MVSGRPRCLEHLERTIPGHCRQSCKRLANHHEARVRALQHPSRWVEIRAGCRLPNRRSGHAGGPVPRLLPVHLSQGGRRNPRLQVHLAQPTERAVHPQREESTDQTLHTHVVARRHPRRATPRLTTQSAICHTLCRFGDRGGNLLHSGRTDKVPYLLICFLPPHQSMAVRNRVGRPDSQS